MANYYSGDPYVGTRANIIKEKNEKIDTLEKENARLKAQLKQLEQR